MRAAVRLGEVLTDVMEVLERKRAAFLRSRPKRASEWLEFPRTFSLDLVPHCGEVDRMVGALKPHYLDIPRRAVSRLPSKRRDVVYAFLAEADGNTYEPMYVGQSTRLDLRIPQHLDKERGISHGLRSMEVRGYFIRIAVWTTCPCLKDWIEDRLIRTLRPLLNREEGQPWETEICTCGAYS